MDRLRQMLATIRQQITQMSVTNMMLVAALVVIMVGALLFAARLSSTRTMVELLPGMPAEDQAKAKAYLEKMDITHEAKGGKVYVLPEKRTTVLASMAESGQLPQNTGVLFSNLASRTTWMDPKSKQDFWNLRAIEGELAAIIHEFRGVESSKVLISNPEPIGIGQSFRKPTAMVTVFLKGGRALDRNMVDALAAMVSGSVAGLSHSDIKIIDGSTGRQMTPRSPGEFAAGDYMEHKQKVEELVQGKVADYLRYIPNVMVAVNASVDIRKTATKTVSMLPEKQGSIKIVESETSKTNSQGGASTGPGEPGFGSNNTADINRAGAGGASKSEQEDSDRKFRVGLGSKTEETVDNKGMPTMIAVAVSLPREYVSAIARQGKKASGAAGGAAGAGGGAGGGGDDPSEDEIKKAFDAEKARLEADLNPLVKTAAADAGASADQQQRSVTVSLIPVPIMPGIVGTGGTMIAGFTGAVGAGGGEGGSSGGGLVGTIVGSGVIKQGIMALLALGSLGMMFMLVRKSGKPVELPTAEQIVGLPPALQPEQDVVGEADESQTAMLGIELGDEQLKSKKMLEQVGELVKKNPADAAVLLNRWVTVEE